MGEKRTMSLSGSLETQDVDKLPDQMTLDFTDVTSVSFSALRALLALHERSHGVEIVNASDDVFLLFDSTGVRRHIPISRQPSEIDLGSWRTAGDANQGDCYFDASGDRMVKLFRDTTLFASAQREAQGSYAAFVSGVPTPLVAGEVRWGNRVGIMYECARNKKSVSRLIADDPEHIDDYVKTFADMCIKLHQTECDTSVANSVVDPNLGKIDEATYFTCAQRSRLLKVIEDTEPATTCVHGDLHIGNLVICDSGPQFIDMGEFGYGNPLFDLGTAYFTAVMSTHLSNSIIERNFHFPAETMLEVWRLFARHYAGAETPSQLEEFEHQVIPYGVLRGVTLCNLTRTLAPPIFEGYLALMDELFFSRS